MNPSSIFTNLLANKHTSGAALVYVLLKLAIPILAIWMPELKPKLDATSGYLETGAIGYGLLAAGDASQGKKRVDELKTETATAIETGDTTHLKKSDV